MLGITVGNMLWAGLALGGLHLIFGRVVWLQTALRVLGGTYLVYLGVQMWRASLAGARMTRSTLQCW